jgi:uncharacterized membrane protein
LSILVYAFLIGVIAGLRALMAPTIVSWGAGLGWFSLAGSSLNFMSFAVTRYILSFLALGELINDKRPNTPSRKVPPQFITRIVTGAFSGAVLGASRDSLVGGLVAGAIGAVAGTLGGSAARTALAKVAGKDLPVAFLEDLIAIFGALFIVSRV